MWCPPRRDGLGGIFVCRVSNFPINLVHTHVAVVAGERSKTDDVHFHAPNHQSLHLQDCAYGNPAAADCSWEGGIVVAAVAVASVAGW